MIGAVLNVAVFVVVSLMRSFRLFVLSLMVLLSVSAVNAEQALFPSPEALQPDIRFWQRVYTEISSSQGFIHDDRNLGVVYETVQLQANMKRRARYRKVNSIKKRYKSVLLKLARGNRTSLNQEEQRILTLWPEGTSNKEFRAAAKRLRFQLGQSDRFKEGLVRSGKWLAYIKIILKETGVPEELAALPHVESSFNPGAYSFVGAAGLWQFTRSTGKRFMHIDHVVDERLDPYISTVAAARLLKYNYETTGTWPLAITAYNHGVSGMRRATRKLGGTDIVPILARYDGRTFGFASRNFYVAFLAAVEVSRNVEKHFGKVALLPEEKTVLVEIPDFIPVSTLSKAIKQPQRLIKRNNPALRPTVYNGTKFVPKGYKIRLPGNVNLTEIEQGIASISQKDRYAQQKPDVEYRVKRGDTLSQIAERFGIGLSKLVAANNLSSKHRIRIGQKLRLPSNARMPKTLAEFKANPDGYYSVKRGDSISLIADRFNLDADLLLEANNINNPHTIFAGQKIKVANLNSSAQAVQLDIKTVSDDKPSNIQQDVQVDILSMQETAPKESGQSNSTDIRPGILISDGSEAEAVAIHEILVPADEKIESAEPVSSEEAELIAPVQPAGLHPALSADPSDYTVQQGNKVIVQAAETLGHYAHWLQIPTQRLRDINRLRRQSEVVIGRKVKLDFSKVGKELFEQRRVAYHRDLQESFFNQYTITGTVEHTIRRGEVIWSLSQLEYNVPIWLLRQHNPDLRFKKIRAGDKVVFPVVEHKSNNQIENNNLL